MQETCSTLTVTGLCLPISMHGFVERGEQPTCADEQYLRVGVSLFDSKRGEVGKYSANYISMRRSVYCTAAVFNRIRGVGDFLGKSLHPVLYCSFF